MCSFHFLCSISMNYCSNSRSDINSISIVNMDLGLVCTCSRKKMWQNNSFRSQVWTGSLNMKKVLISRIHLKSTQVSIFISFSKLTMLFYKISKLHATLQIRSKDMHGYVRKKNFVDESSCFFVWCWNSIQIYSIRTEHRTLFELIIFD